MAAEKSMRGFFLVLAMVAALVDLLNYCSLLCFYSLLFQQSLTQNLHSTPPPFPLPCYFALVAMLGAF